MVVSAWLRLVGWIKEGLPPGFSWQLAKPLALSHLAWWTAFSWWELLVLVVFCRRWLADGSAPLAGWILAVLGICGVTCSVLCRHFSPLPRNSRAERWCFGTLAVTNLLLLISLTSPQSPVLAAILAWTYWVAAETSWRRVLPTPNPVPAIPPPLPTTPLPETPLPETLPPSRIRSTGLDGDGETLPPDISQQWTRSVVEQADCLSGLFRVEFGPGVRAEQVHVPFCPPFATQPDVQAVAVEGVPARVKITQVETFGARVEIKLEQVARQVEQVLFEFSATGHRS